MKTVNVHEAKTQFSKLLAKVHDGEEVIICKAGVPWAKLTPFTEDKKRIPGIAIGNVTDAFFEPLPESELEKWE
ncbi:MAG: type II toxin-antitoxin system Phd/YefM family antitoxin [Deltaproteobacteria bacterium]|jgi:prevent-host-death family protein|nr:type II toxin-antitoxin system Phd/YefM family antitoxin [Deltaproteobacteria bacterium]